MLGMIMRVWPGRGQMHLFELQMQRPSTDMLVRWNCIAR